VGSSAERVARIAARLELAIGYGYPERDGDDVYNAALLIDANGQTLLNYRKSHLFGAAEKTSFRAGERLDAVATLNGWTVGLLICYDVEFTEATRLLALAGADLVLVPTALMTPYDSLPGVLIPARAYENQLYLAYANYCGSEDDLDYCGNSVIVSPTGERLASAEKDETLLLADISATELVASRKLNTYLADRRPNLYRGLCCEGNGP
jgi:predicted amidohydrolase